MHHNTVKKFNAISNVLLFLLLATVIVMALELIFRAKSEFRVSSLIYDKELGWKKKPGKTPISKDSKKYEFINEDGFKDKNKKIEKEPFVKRVLFLGDSYTYGVLVPNEYIFPAVFEELIKTSQTEKYEIINAAIPAWGTDQQLLYLEQKGLQYKPDYVILVICPNDIRDVYGKNFFYIDETNSLKKSGKPEISLKNRILWYFANHFHLYQFIQKMLGTEYGQFNNNYNSLSYQISTGFLVNHNEWCKDEVLYLRKLPEEVKSAYALFKSILLEINEVCKKNQSELLVTVVPTKWEYAGHLAGPLYQVDKISQYVEDVAAENSIRYFDLRTIFDRLPNPMEMYLKNEFHFNIKGHRFVAESLHDLFRMYLKEKKSGKLCDRKVRN
jgi:lysophospholipase L1-like esterase